MAWYVVGSPVPPGQQAAGAGPAVPCFTRRVPVGVQIPNALHEHREEKG